MNIKFVEKINRPAKDGFPKLNHFFSEQDFHAVEAALYAERPLLVRGEPGIGKSQLARAAAVVLKRAYVQYVVDSRTESSDLLWHYDAVSRLAEAQLRGACGDVTSREELHRDLAVRNFVHPRPLWWALNWDSAAKQAEKQKHKPPRQAEGCDSNNGCVVLIDEIDKAESDVPNGLLEALGMGSFHPPGWEDPVMRTEKMPLVIITTNEERALPPAFVRRCLVLHMGLPREEKHLKQYLIERANVHFNLDQEVLNRAAEILIQDRREAEAARWRPLPGQAEFLDLLRAVSDMAPEEPKEQEKLLNRVARFTVSKHPDAKRNQP
ncbi:MAG: AAA family ATPase [Magnetococcales bacterium]|nr:AAA family ATPase [Magnetococcales bacterium]MBF0149468.1 AAA family ATPase [Magnetococcales bacterium]